ncbi:hypothetical protein [Caballeronia insecticola]|uniref:Uncharacterized protein n=1 Tax=Caballeronia insecticola TaxID=758793 RepID=R4WQV4_9BURK|nr:hypothetical protein [Caballeronia insecticola]BAN27083.1 hypothetical protein BRPE64_DCDS01470 [Caballeronia insecticola]
MFQTMEGNARPHRTAEVAAEQMLSIEPVTQAELLSTLQSVSDNIMRLAGKLRAEPDASAHDAATITEQHALAQQLIGRLLALPASQA